MKRVLLVGFVSLQVLDVVSTNRFLDAGIATEGNPLIQYLMDHLGTWWWVPKMLFTPVLTYLVHDRIRYLTVLTLWYVIVVTNNFLL